MKESRIFGFLIQGNVTEPLQIQNVDVRSRGDKPNLIKNCTVQLKKNVELV